MNDHEPGRRDITGDRAGGVNLQLVSGRHIAGDRTHDHHGLCGDLRFDVGACADGERVSRQRDASFHLTAQGEVLGSAELALDDRLVQPQ